MLSPDRPTFSSRLVIPVSWQPLDRAPTRAALDALERQNAGVLDFLLHGIDLDVALRPGDDGLTEAFHPVRVKLDLIIEMLSRLSYRDVVLPDPQEIDIGLDRILWSSPTQVPIGSWLRIALYFHEAYREPVALYGEVVGCAPGDESGIWRLEAELSEMSEAIDESFARLIFLEHRRRLAQRPARALAR